MAELITIKLDKGISPLSAKEKNSHLFLDMAHMYCCIRNYHEAFEWCLSYLEWFPKNAEIESILDKILTFSKSKGLKKQIDSLK